MTKYRMQGPDGKTYEIDGPAGASANDVRAAIIQQNPHLVALTRPTLTTKPQPASQPKDAPQAPSKNWLQRAADFTSTPALDRGIQDAIPGIDHIAHAASALGTLLELHGQTLSSQEIHDQRQNAMQQDKNGPSTGAAVGHYVGEGLGMLGTGVGVAGAGTKLLARGALSSAPSVAKVANYLQNAVKLKDGARIANAGKIAAQGAAFGAATGAADSNKLSDVAGNAETGAIGGAIGGPLLHGALKFASGLAQPAADFLGQSSAASILRRYVNTTAEQLQAARTTWKARTGAEPTLAELLPLGDMQGLQKLIGMAPSQTREKAASLITQRVANIGKEIGDKTSSILDPHRQPIVDQMASDIARSRGDTVPTAQDIALANDAARNPNALAGKRNQNSLAATEASNIMYPHNDRVVAGSIDDLVPQTPNLQSGGSVAMHETDPDISGMIRNAAGLQNVASGPVNVRTVTNLISKLRKTANTSPDMNQAGLASRAAQHLSEQLPEDARAAHDYMTQQYAARRRMAEGMTEGQKTRLEENIPDPQIGQDTQNAYGTPEGAQGRILGQASALDQLLTRRPNQNLTAASDLAANPTTQEAIDRNVGPVGPAGPTVPVAGTQIGDAAAAQTESARNLARLDAETPDTGVNLPDIATNLLKLSPGSLPYTKATALSKLARLGINLPSKQAGQLVDTLFSQNPAQIDIGLKFLNNAGSAGRAALRDLATTVAGSTTGAAAAVEPGHGATFGDDPVPVPQGETQVGTIDDNAGGQAPQYGTVADNSAAQPSQYQAQLEAAHAAADPRLLSLLPLIKQRESASGQFDKNGNPVISSAGAVGGMQVMPGTAKGIASQRGLPVDPAALYHDPAYNELMGIHVLDQNLGHYGGDRQKAAAAYNSNPATVDAAIAKDPTGWINHLPAETQKYIQGIEP